MMNGEYGYTGNGGDLWLPRSSWFDRLPRISPIRRAGPIILMYHQVTVLERDHWSLAVSPQHFAEHLAVLARRREPVALRRLTDELATAQLNRRQVAITFDDGYADNLTNAKPILERFDIPATVFVVGDAVGQERELWWDELDRVFLGRHALPEQLQIHLRGRSHRWALENKREGNPFRSWRGGQRERLRRFLWRQLRAVSPAERWRVIDELQTWAGQPPQVRPERRVMTEEEVIRLGADGLIEIGSHTASHPRLSALPPAAQLDDIVRGKVRLEEIIGAPVTSFSYPFGGQFDLSTITVEAVRQAGFARACTTRKGTVQPSTDPLRLPRLYVADWSGDEFERQLAPWL
jgi:peptidoglycan/xylan/chitin deacetylase (PgdA/CDA1 family)